MLLKLKLTHWIIIALIIFSGYQYYKKTLVAQENLDLKSKNKDNLQKVRDSAFAEIDHIAVTSKKKIDDLILIGQEIKYIPYEKLIYDNRDIDTSLDIISNYRYNEGAAKTD